MKESYNLATARQYLGQRDLAQNLFQDALELARTTGQRQDEDLILHHRGRCFVEQGKLAEAEACFEQALVLRKRKGDERGIVRLSERLTRYEHQGKESALKTWLLLEAFTRSAVSRKIYIRKRAAQA